MDDIRDSFSRLKKKIKHELTGSKHKPDRIGPDAPGERAKPTGKADGRRDRSTNQAPQLEYVPAGGSDNDQRKEEVDVRGTEVSQRSPHLSPDADVAVTVGSRHSGEVERICPSSSTPSIPHGGNPDSASTVPDHALVALHPDESVEASAADEKQLNWKSTASATAKLLLRGVRDSADAFGPLKSVAGGLCFILENCERTKANRHAIESLAPRVKAFAELLCAPVSEGDVKEQERRKKLEQKLQDVRRGLAPLKQQGKAEGFFNNFENAGKLDGLVENIRDAMMEYQTSLQQDLYEKSFLLIESVDFALLGGMHRAPDAGYRCGDRQGCLRGTRKDVLWEIEHWSTAEQGQRVFWLNGLAGTGKSTIAQTFAETSFADGKLGASFFCSRDFAGRSSLQAIFPTLAFQLAYQYPCFRKELLQVLKARPDVGWESLCSQMEKLIVGPLKAAHISTLIIIDALDECKDEEPASAILSVLSRYMDQIPNVKFFITGRPEPRIRSGFRLESLAPITEVLKLHEVKPEAVDRDIELFFQTQLNSLTKNRSDCDLTEDWPNPSDIKILCKKAAGFFIYASTVVKFVASGSDLLTERLALITFLPQSTSEEGKSGVDQLYIKVLEQASYDVRVDKSQHYLRFRTVVGTVLLVFNPLSIKGLSELLKCHISHIRSTTRSLHSLLLIPEKTEDPILPFHKSFPDFLMDPERCKDRPFFVDPAAHHAEIVLLCLNLISERLKRNICNLDDYAVLSEVKDVSDCRKDHIGDALEYACCFWTKHLQETHGNSSCIEEVQKAIDNFFTTHLLDWIEVLALTGNLGVGVHAMNDIEQWCTLTGILCKWTADSQRFLLEHFDTINNSPSHIYHSALPLCPSSSWLHKCYSAELPLQVKVFKGLPAGWGMCSRTVSFDDILSALSYWNHTIAVGLVNSDIVIFDTITGSQTAVFSGHTDRVRSLIFSSDGMLLVSGSYDKTVKLWDVQTGGVVKTFSGHTHKVQSVSISADCTTIASGSKDNTICLWDIQTGECHHIIEQQDPVWHVCFSPTDPQYLLFVSGHRVWQWDISSHQIPPGYDGFQVAFSPDGTQFVLSNKAAVTVRNSDSRVIVAEFHMANCNTSFCCFSPDGRLVAVAAGDTAHIWDITGSDPHLVETLIGHTSSITSLVFSSPSSLVSASYDRSVKFWQIGISSTDPVETDPKSTPLNSTPIKSITLQAKDGVAILSDLDGVVRIWDISTGICKISFRTPAKASSHRDARLIDGKLIFVWHADERIYIWDLEKGEVLQTVDTPRYQYRDHKHQHEDLRISGDGSKIFYLCMGSIQAWSIETGEVVGRVQIEVEAPQRSLTVDGTQVWAHRPQSEYQGWNFGILDSSPIQLPSVPTLCFSGTMVWNNCLSRVEDTITGQVVFQLSGRFAKPLDVQCNGYYLAACYTSGEVLILDFSDVFFQ